MSHRHESFTVDESPRIVVGFSSGRLAVQAGEVGTVDVSIHGRRADEFTINQVGNTINVRLESRGMGAGSHQVGLVVPESTRLEVSSASGDIEVDRLADLTVQVASGDVHAKLVTGDLTVKSASGDIVVGRCGGRLAIASASGDVEVSEAGADVNCTTVSGDVDIDTLAGSASMKSVSGDVTIDRFEGPRFTGKTMSGDVEVGVPSGRILDIDLVTRSGRTRLPTGSGSSGDVDKKVVDIVCKSVSGDITIETA